MILFCSQICTHYWALLYVAASLNNPSLRGGFTEWLVVNNYLDIVLKDDEILCADFSGIFI